MSISTNTVNIQIYELLQEANTLLKTDKQKAIDFLRNNRFRTIIEGYLKLTYDPSIVFRLPPGVPPFKKQTDVPDGYCLTDLKQEFRRMRIFTDPELNITNIRREQLWLQMCEGLFWKEADLINKIKDRRITDMYDGLTADFIREVFPNLLPEEVAAPVPEEAIAPVDLGEDPSLIPEIELIRAGIKEHEEELKKAQAGLEKGNPTPAKRGRGRPRKTPESTQVTPKTTKKKKPTEKA